jgi:DNA helicase-2/ATP-dependent DNA helicase PcrA
VIALLDNARKAGLPIHLDQFALITFTNKAANELRGRLRRDLANVAANAGSASAFWEEQEERLGAAYVGTIHGYCHSVARQFAYTHNLARAARTGGTGDLLDQAFRDAFTSHLAGNPKHPLYREDRGWAHFEFRSQAIDALTMIRQAGVSPTWVARQTKSANHADPGAPWREAFADFIADFGRRYQDACIEAQRVDPDGLLAAFRRALEDSPDFRQKAADRFPFVFVDEFQDTDGVQAHILRYVEPHLSRLVVVGDRKQSIYRFRGAQHTLLQDLANDFTAGVLFPLRLARRPMPRLLEAQNALFEALSAHFTELDEPLADPQGSTPAPDPFPVIRYAEAIEDEISNEVRQMVGKPASLRRLNRTISPIEYGDIVVLARTNRDVDRMVATLKDGGIPAEADAGTSAFRGPALIAVRRLLVLLTAWDDGAVLEAMSTPLFAEGDLAGAEAASLREQAIATPTTRRRILDRLCHEEFEAEATGAPPGILTRLRRLRRKLPYLKVSALLGEMYADLSLVSRVRTAYGEAAIADLDRLRDLARSLAVDGEALTLDIFLASLDREIASDSKLEAVADGDTPPPHVRVMTVHRAKGLEFPVVVLPYLSRQGVLWQRDLLLWPNGELEAEVRAGHGLETTLSPGFKKRLDSERELEIDQEMRLLYVAVTRAENHVLFLGDRGGRAPKGKPRTWQEALLCARPTFIARQCAVEFG